MTKNTMSEPEETTRLKGDISKFVEEPVRWRIFHQTVLAAREAFADVSPDKLQNMIDEAADEASRRLGAEALHAGRM